MNSSRPMTRRGHPRLLLASRIILSLVFAGAAGAKLAGVPEIVDLFARIGFGEWFRHLTAALEATGAALLLLPATTVLGATLLAAVMVGAVITNIALGSNPIGAVVLLAALIVVGWAQHSTRKEIK